MTDARRQADEALAAYGRIEATLAALAALIPEQRGLLPWAMFDSNDLARLRATLRCHREKAGFDAAFGLPSGWRRRARRDGLQELVAAIPAKQTEPLPRA